MTWGVRCEGGSQRSRVDTQPGCRRRDPRVLASRRPRPSLHRLPPEQASSRPTNASQLPPTRPTDGNPRLVRGALVAAARAAVRWHGRFALETTGPDLADSATRIGRTRLAVNRGGRCERGARLARSTLRLREFCWVWRSPKGRGSGGLRRPPLRSHNLSAGGEERTPEA